MSAVPRLEWRSTVQPYIKHLFITFDHILIIIIIKKNLTIFLLHKYLISNFSVSVFLNPKYILSQENLTQFYNKFVNILQKLLKYKNKCAGRG